MKPLPFFFLFPLFFAFFQTPSAAQNFAPDTFISQDIRTAFKNAGIPVLRQRTLPVDFTLPYANGQNVTLSSLKGRVVFLNFWATWCPPCREEMPSMESLYRRFRDKGMEFLAVDIQEDPAKVAAFFEEFGLTFPAALDRNGLVSGKYGIRGIPSTFIIDRNGSMIAAVVGGKKWDTQAVISAFETLLGAGQ
jgi:thiol-disulfide isomerase/thioredoxin